MRNLPRPTPKPDPHLCTYQTLQIFSGGFARAALPLHLKASANSGIFTTTPLIRYLPGECGLVTAIRRRFSGRLFSDAHCAKPTKKRCSGVRPSLTSSLTPFVASRSEEHTSELQSLRHLVCRL